MLRESLNNALYLNKGFSYYQISKLIFLEDNTIRNCIERYVLEGIEGLLKYDHQKPLSYLSATEFNELDERLQNKMYLHSKKYSLAY